MRVDRVKDYYNLIAFISFPKCLHNYKTTMERQYNYIREKIKIMQANILVLLV